MHDRKPQTFLLAFLLALFFVASPASAQEPQPGDACPVADYFMRVSGPENPGSGHFLVCDSSLVWQPIMRFLPDGHVLFNSGGTPAAPLHVWGEAIIGNSGLTCGPAQDGAVRYVSSGASPPWVFCDGSAWVNFKQPRCQDDDTGECYLDATRSNDDPEFVPGNILDGVNILGVTGIGACPGTFSVNEDFGASGTFTDFVNVTGDDHDWTGNTGNTGSTGVGPSDDHTGGEGYGYTEASSPVAAGEEFWLQMASTLTGLDTGDCAVLVDFAWNKRGDDMGDLFLEYRVDGGAWQVVWQHLGPDVPSGGVDVWRSESVSLGAITGDLDVRFRGKMPLSGTIYHSDIGIDSISVHDGPPPAIPESPVNPECTDDFDNQCILEAIRGNDDPEFVASNIADGVNILGVTGTKGSSSQTGTVSSVDLDGARDVAVAGNYAYVVSSAAHSLTVIDISDPANPVQTGTISTGIGGALGWAEGVAVAGNYAYVGSGTGDALTVVDVSDPANPVQTGTVSTGALDGAWGVAVAGDYAYVAGFHADSLTVVDVSDPANPVQTGTVSSADMEQAMGVAVAGDYAYVASEVPDSLTVVDVSDPANPVQVGTVSSVDLDKARGVAVAGNYAYVASSIANSLTVIDVSNPANPAQVGTVSSFDLNGTEGVAVAGDYAYVTGFGADSLTVVDVSDPANPVQVGAVSSFDMNGAGGVAVAGDYAYVTGNSADSLTVLDLGDFKVAEYFDCTDDNLDTCVLDQNRSKYDTDFKPQNICTGMTILGVTGTAAC